MIPPAISFFGSLGNSMFPRFPFLVAFLTLAAWPLHAEEAPKTKLRARLVEPAVYFGLSASGNDVVVSVNRTVGVPKKVTKIEKVTRDGLEEEVPVTKVETSYQNVKELHSFKKTAVKVFNLEGKEIPAKDWDQVLKKDTVIFLGKGEEIDPQWSQLLKPETPILLIPWQPNLELLTELDQTLPGIQRTPNSQPVPGLPRRAPTIAPPPA